MAHGRLNWLQKWRRSRSAGNLRRAGLPVNLPGGTIRAIKCCPGSKVGRARMGGVSSQVAGADSQAGARIRLPSGNPRASPRRAAGSGLEQMSGRHPNRQWGGGALICAPRARWGRAKTMGGPGEQARHPPQDKTPISGGRGQPSRTPGDATTSGGSPPLCAGAVRTSGARLRQWGQARDSRQGPSICAAALSVGATLPARQKDSGGREAGARQTPAGTAASRRINGGNRPHRRSLRRRRAQEPAAPVVKVVWRALAASRSRPRLLAAVGASAVSMARRRAALSQAAAGAIRSRRPGRLNLDASSPAGKRRAGSRLSHRGRRAVSAVSRFRRPVGTSRREGLLIRPGGTRALPASGDSLLQRLDSIPAAR